MVIDSYDSIPQKTPSKSSMRLFIFLIVLIQITGITLVILVGVWRGQYHGGMSFTESVNTKFNWHPLLMVLGMIFLYANGILVYRVFRSGKKIYLKIAHGFILISVLVISSIGLKAVFDSHNYNPAGPVANMYTLHSWLGIIAISLFGFQWLMGFCTFLLPYCSDKLKMLVKPLHIFLGSLIFLLASATALLGLTEKALWEIGKNYQTLEGESVLVNVIGLFIVLLVSLVIYVVVKGDYRRVPLYEEETLQLTN